MRTFVCAYCGEQFETDRTEEECKEEAKVNFPDWDYEDKAVVCSPCYEKLKEIKVRPEVKI